jgi:hypothetical protein
MYRIMFANCSMSIRSRDRDIGGTFGKEARELGQRLRKCDMGLGTGGKTSWLTQRIISLAIQRRKFCERVISRVSTFFSLIPIPTQLILFNLTKFVSLLNLYILVLK